MSKNIKSIVKNLKLLLSMKTNSKSTINSITVLKKFTNDIAKRKKKITTKEIEFIEQKLLLLMKELHTLISKKKFSILIESMSLLSSMKEISEIKQKNKMDDMFLDLDSKDDNKDETPIEVKKIDTNLIEPLTDNLKSKVFSQDIAIEKVVSAIKINAAGLGEKNKPIGSFLFTGPTGVGKTELAKELAKQLNIEFVRFDMSEYSHESTSSKLIGASAGYTGHDKGGLLTNAILEHSSSVLLLDEIEKADPDLMPIFLQMMDNAELTDSHGKKVSFKNVIIIMTSNLGTKEENVVGFNNEHKHITNGIASFFSPEFINRLDSIIKFQHLQKDVALSIVDKFLSDISSSLTDRKITLNVSDSAKEKLSLLGYSSEMGAREMGRTIVTSIKRPISEEILFGEIKDGGDVIVDILNNEFNFSYKTDC